MQLPAIAWPAVLEELGPAADPTILLSADVRIGNAQYVVTAIRMRENQRMPDYRGNVDRHEYGSDLDEMLEEIENFTHSIAPDLLTLEDGQYLLWMVPAVPSEA